MSLTAKQKHDLKKLFNELASHKGSHTELVTVYVPSGYDIVKIQQHLAQEQGTAVNIKSTGTRKNVIDALEKMIQHLRLYKQTPPNGLMAFSGNVAEREGQSDVKVWSIEPPVPLQMRLYRCDKVFVLDALADMLEDKEAYGLVVIDGRDATLALLKGKSIIPLLKTHSEVPGKMKAGGQCLTEKAFVFLENEEKISIKNLENYEGKVMSLNLETKQIVPVKSSNFFKRKVDKIIALQIGDKKIEATPEHPFLTQNGWVPACKLIRGEILATCKEDEIEKDNLLQKQLILKWESITKVEQKIGEFDVYDISVPEYHNFVANNIVVHNSALRFQKNADLAALAHRKKVADYITEQFYNKPEIKGILLGGPGHTKYKLKDELNEQIKKKIIAEVDLSYTDEFGLQELVEKCQDVLAAEDVAHEKKLMNKFFENLAKNDKIVSYGKTEVKRTLELGAVDILLLSESLSDAEIEEFETTAKQFGTTVELISVETREGVQLRDMGGIAAILRYEVH